MPTRTLDHCALHYLNQWAERDRHYYDALASADEAVQLKGLKKAGAFYRVARNLPTSYEKSSVYSVTNQF
jgi:hypothetical protein